MNADNMSVTEYQQALTSPLLQALIQWHNEEHLIQAGGHNERGWADAAATLAHLLYSVPLGQPLVEGPA
jgi:hypothetical protein